MKKLSLKQKTDNLNGPIAMDDRMIPHHGIVVHLNSCVKVTISVISFDIDDKPAKVLYQVPEESEPK